MLTVREFLALPSWRQLLYRLYRHPIVMFGVGPTYLFVLQHRLPVGLMRSSWHFWLSTMATNLAIAVLAATMIWLVGLGPVLASAIADHAPRRFDWRLAVLRPAPIRGHFLDP